MYSGSAKRQPPVYRIIKIRVTQFFSFGKFEELKGDTGGFKIRVNPIEHLYFVQPLIRVGFEGVIDLEVNQRMTQIA